MMSPQEAWLLVAEQRPPKMIGNLTERKFNELRDILHSKSVH